MSYMKWQNRRHTVRANLVFNILRNILAQHFCALNTFVTVYEEDNQRRVIGDGNINHCGNNTFHQHLQQHHNPISFQWLQKKHGGHTCYILKITRNRKMSHMKSEKCQGKDTTVKCSKPNIGLITWGLPHLGFLFYTYIYSSSVVL